MLNSKSSFPLRTSSSRGDSFITASCRSLEVIKGRPLTLTIISPSWIPPLQRQEEKGSKYTFYADKKAKNHSPPLWLM